MPTPPVDVEAYLSRTGCHAVVAKGSPPSLATLSALHEAHVAAVPFENLDILLGRPILLHLESLQAKLVTARRGGYCFEHNTLFMAVLQALGYEVTPLSARVRAGATEVRPRTHMLLRVDLHEGPFLADVGFGGDGPIRPLPLEVEREVPMGGDSFRLRHEEGSFVLEGTATGTWGDLYAFTLERAFPSDYEMANHFTSTFPRSPFVQNLVVQRSWPDRRAVLRNRELVVRSGAARESSSIRDPEHLLEVLDTLFGLSFPADTRFSQPAF
jgi:N-hydroxyarylamine O-acetyltransferase